MTQDDRYDLIEQTMAAYCEEMGLNEAATDRVIEQSMVAFDAHTATALHESSVPPSPETTTLPPS